MFDGFNLVANAIFPPSPPDRASTRPASIAESIQRPSTAVQSAPSFKRSNSKSSATSSRPLSLITDALLPAHRPARSASAMAQRKPTWISRRGSVTKSTQNRNSTILEDEFESESISQTRERVYRWDGVIGARSEWDCIRRDNELWTPEGDALIHFYAQGQSRRGPSIRLAFADIQQCNCGPLLDGLVQGASAWELYIPAPRRLDRHAAFRYHLTTRNLFAWMFDRPVVGSRLGPALIELHERLNEARNQPAQNAQDMATYIESQGYADFRDNPDHALGMLVYAEHFKLPELWTDAFVHCAGQYDELSNCLDWPSVPLTTKALLARATCEMQVRLQRASGDLMSFMEESMNRLNLPDDVQRHLERFRSFLHSFYVEQIGYWPPESPSKTLQMTLMRSMYTDFRSLYELLADTEPEWASILSGSTASSRSTTRIDMPAMTRSYDDRYRYSSLPYTQALLPKNIPTEHDSLLTSILPNFGYVKRARLGRRAAVVSALQQAMNAPSNHAAASAPLVRAYRDFERTTTLQAEERITPATGRAARWLLIYAALQTLADATRAPREVSETEGVSYPLCCQTAGTPPWSTVVKQLETDELDSHAPQTALAPAAIEEEAPIIEEQVAYVRGASPDPSLTVAPLDLEAVANKRRSLVVTTTDAPIKLHAPKPRRPASDGALAALEAYPMATSQIAEDKYVSEANYEQASVAASDDVPELSPTSDRHSHHSRNSSDATGSESGDAHTPKSADAQSAIFDRYFGRKSPGANSTSSSIYEDDGDDADRLSAFNMLGAINKPGSEELAARWRGEIGI